MNLSTSHVKKNWPVSQERFRLNLTAGEPVLSPENLERETRYLLEHPEKLEDMKNKAKVIAKPDAAGKALRALHPKQAAHRGLCKLYKTYCYFLIAIL